MLILNTIAFLRNRELTHFRRYISTESAKQLKVDYIYSWKKKLTPGYLKFWMNEKTKKKKEKKVNESFKKEGILRFIEQLIIRQNSAVQLLLFCCCKDEKNIIEWSHVKTFEFVFYCLTSIFLFCFCETNFDVFTVFLWPYLRYHNLKFPYVTSQFGSKLKW